MIESYQPTVKSPENSDSDSPESDSDKKKSSKKYTNKTVIFGGKVTESAFESTPAKPTGRAESLWQRLVKLDDKEGESKESRPKESKETPAAEKSESDESSPEVTIEELSREETREVALDYAETRKAAVMEEVETDAEGTDQTPSVEAAADAALLVAIKKELAENPDKSIEEVLDSAEAETLELLNADESAETQEAADAEGTPEAAIEGEIPLKSEDGAEDAEDTVIPVRSTAGGAVPPVVPPVAGGGAGTGGGGAVPPFGGGPGGPSPSPGPGGPGGPGSPGGPPVPVGPGGPGRYAGFHAGGPGFNAAPVAPAMTYESSLTSERRAMAQGLLVGGIVGYLIGRRRGRIKTEKKLLPIQKKLEKQVASLHETIAFKEQNIRKLAGEKAQALSLVERRNLAERLAPAPAEPARPAYESARIEKSSAERFSRGVVEAPAVILGGVAAIRPERGRGQGPEKSRPVIDFNKKVEAYSTEELKEAAENIKIDNTTLKELYDDGRLDEKAVRRVMTEFIEGGSVRAAVSRELLQKELKFERDPKMRDAQGGQSGGGGVGAGAAAGIAAGAVAVALSGSTGSSSSSSAGGTHDNFPGSRSKPTLDKAALAKLRKKQTVEVAAASAAVVTFFAVIIALLL